jgi:UV DNA damage endonuclease
MFDDLPKLGLVCVTASEEVRFRTVTRRTISKLSVSEQQEKLRQVYTANLINLAKAIAFCQKKQIQLYRLSSALFPFADTPLGNEILSEFESQLEEIGNEAKRLNIRLVLHPNQYVVLNSDRSEVVENSIKILTTHAHILDLLGLPCSSWTSINIHGGKGDRAGKLINNIQQLPQNVYSRLTLENDEYTYSSQAIAEICHAAKVPMVFDAHHHLIYEHLDSYDHPRVGEMLEIARTTWEKPQWQLVHISNGREHFHDNKHSDLIINMPSSFHNAPWIEIEAKLKEQAIAKLRQEWLRSRSLKQSINWVKSK